VKEYQVSRPLYIEPRKGKAKRCYGLALRFVLHHEGPEDIRLVHGLWGMTHPKDGRTITDIIAMEHAWVDMGNGVIYEPVSCQYIDKQWCESHFRIMELTRYTTREAAGMVLEHNHNGPWVLTPQAAFFEFYGQEYKGEQCEDQ